MYTNSKEDCTCKLTDSQLLCLFSKFFQSVLVEYSHTTCKITVCIFDVFKEFTLSTYSTAVSGDSYNPFTLVCKLELS